MNRYDYDVGVLGGGAAGLTVTAGAARAGAKVLLVEKEKRLGGDCLYYGCVPSKTLIRTAQVYNLMRRAGRFGLPAPEVGRVDFREVAKRIGDVIGAIAAHDSEERFCGLGAKVEYGEPRFADEHTISLDGRRYSAKYWVIATGSSPAVPPVVGLTETEHLTNRDIFSLDRLPESMTIIGGGPIGIEVAQAFARLGTKVTVIEFQGRILANDDPDMTEGVREILEEEGVEFFLGAAVMSVKEEGGRKEVTFKRENEMKTVSSEALLVAAGRKVNLEGLGLEEIDVVFGRRGLELDGRLRTARPNIFGAGDVTGTYQFTHAAGYEGGVVLANCIFHLPRKADYRHIPWVTYTDPELASLGMNEAAARSQGIGYSVWSEEFGQNDRGLAEGEARGKIKMLLDNKEKLLGIQILGPQAGDLMSEWVAVMTGGVKLSTLASAVHPYPTLGEINKRVAGNFMATKIFSEKMQKALKLFFSLKGRACDDGGG